MKKSNKVLDIFLFTLASLSGASFSLLNKLSGNPAIKVWIIILLVVLNITALALASKLKERD